MDNKSLSFEPASFKDLKAYIKVFGNLGKNKRIDATNDEWERAKNMRTRIMRAYKKGSHENGNGEY